MYCKYFSLVYHISFDFVYDFFGGVIEKFLTLMWSNLSVIFLYGFCVGSFSERPYVTQNYENKLSMFSVSALKFQLLYLKLQSIWN